MKHKMLDPSHYKVSYFCDDGKTHTWPFPDHDVEISVGMKRKKNSLHEDIDDHDVENDIKCPFCGRGREFARKFYYLDIFVCYQNFSIC